MFTKSKRSRAGGPFLATLPPEDEFGDFEPVPVEVLDAVGAMDAPDTALSGHQIEAAELPVRAEMPYQAEAPVLPPPDAGEVFVDDAAAVPEDLTYEVADLAMRGGVMTILTVEGPSDALLLAHDDYERETPERPAGQLLHICATTATGIAVYDVWESHDALAAFVSASPGTPSPVVMGLHAIRSGRA